MLRSTIYIIIFFIVSFVSVDLLAGTPYPLSDNWVAYNPHGNFENIADFYNDLAYKLKSRGQNNVESISTQVAVSFAEYQINELERTSPLIRRINQMLRFEINFWESRSSSKHISANNKDGADSTRSPAANRQAKSAENVIQSVNYFKVRTSAHERSIKLMFKTDYFEGVSRFLVTEGNLITNVYNNLGHFQNSLHFNLKESLLNLATQRKLTKNLNVGISASQDFKNDRYYAGMNLGYSF